MFSALLWNLLLTAALAVVLTAVCRLRWMKRRPAVRHTLWLLLLAKLVTPPLIPVPVLPTSESQEAVPVASRTVEDREESTLPYDSAPSTSESAPSTPVFVPSSAAAQLPAALDEEPNAGLSSVVAPVETAGFQWSKLGALLIAVSLLGSFVKLAVYAVRSATMRRWLNRASNDCGELSRCCADVAASLGLRRAVRSCVVDARTAPMLWGCWRPMVVVPSQLVKALSPCSAAQHCRSRVGSPPATRPMVQSVRLPGQADLLVEPDCLVGSSTAACRSENSAATPLPSKYAAAATMPRHSSKRSTSYKASRLSHSRAGARDGWKFHFREV